MQHYNNTNNAWEQVIPVINAQQTTGAVPNLGNFNANNRQHVIQPFPPKREVGDYYRGVQYIYISNIVFAIKQIRKHLKIIQFNIKALHNHIEQQYYYEIYHHIISEITCSIINIIQYLWLIKSEQRYVLEKNSEIQKMYSDQLSNNKSEPYSYALEYIVEHCKDIDILLTNLFQDKINTVYNAMYRMHNFMNNIINTLNFN